MADINQLTQIVNSTLNQYGVKINQAEYGIGNREFSMLLVTELFKADIRRQPKTKKEEPPKIEVANEPKKSPVVKAVERVTA